MAEKPTQQLNPKGIEELLNQQTTVILDAVDSKLLRQQNYVDRRISILEERLSKMELRIDEKFDKLTTTLDRFLKRLTDMEDEFVLMKADIKRVKTALKEKLGVVLD